MEEIPTINKPIARSLIPNNLGIVVKSTRLKDFESLLTNMLDIRCIDNINCIDCVVKTKGFTGCLCIKST